MKIFLNGREIEATEACTIEELVEQHQLSPETTLVEQNGVALRRREWAAQKLGENDRIEVLRVAAGG